MSRGVRVYKYICPATEINSVSLYPIIIVQCCSPYSSRLRPLIFDIMSSCLPASLLTPTLPFLLPSAPTLSPSTYLHPISRTTSTKTLHYHANVDYPQNIPPDHGQRASLLRSDILHCLWARRALPLPVERGSPYSWVLRIRFQGKVVRNTWVRIGFYTSPNSNPWTCFLTPLSSRKNECLSPRHTSELNIPSRSIWWTRKLCRVHDT